GVNAYIDGMRPGDVPMEFRLTNVAPRRWEPINSVHLLNRMGWTLANIDPESDREAAAAKVGRVAANALFPEAEPIVEPIQPNGVGAPRYDFVPLPPPGTPDTAAATVAALVRASFPTRVAERLDRVLNEDATNFASNNWAVSPKRTKNGYALLAGDPHLEL